ncbi:MAG: GDP-mannose 4,6-dehydratase [Methylocystis sp.]|jgi:GDP-4-dehydro-6-deoxy-D-mannose reductase
MAVFERILLTGGSGFVGSHLAPLLADACPEARRELLTLEMEQGPAGRWTKVRGDLLNPEMIDEAIATLRPDLVVHLAGQASIGKALGAGEQTWRANLLGAINLASALARHAPQTTMLFASSASVYGASLNDGAARETAPLRPLDAYGRSKVAAEGVFADVLGARSRLIIARPVNHSGPRQSEKSFVLSSFAAQIAAIEAGRKEPVLHVGDLSKARDFLDVRDVVAAYMLLIEKAEELPNRVNCFNVASGEPHPISELLEGLRRLSTKPFEIRVEPGLLRPSAADIPSIALDAGKLRDATGWRPRHTIDDLLQSLLEYWRGVESPGA